jgi:hypothetical protein
MTITQRAALVERSLREGWSGRIKVLICVFDRVGEEDVSLSFHWTNVFLPTVTDSQSPPILGPSVFQLLKDQKCPEVSEITEIESLG